jgi:hypothetical protein
MARRRQNPIEPVYWVLGAVAVGGVGLYLYSQNQAQQAAAAAAANTPTAQAAAALAAAQAQAAATINNALGPLPPSGALYNPNPTPTFPASPFGPGGAPPGV